MHSIEQGSIVMKTAVSVFFKQSAAFFLYLALTLILVCSVTRQSGTAFVDDLVSYLVALILAFLAFSVAARKLRISDFGSGRPPLLPLAALANLLLAASILFIAGHFVSLGGVPLIKGALDNDYYSIMRTRQSIFMDAPGLFRYGANLLLKSLFPFLILYFYAVRDMKRFWITLFVAICYGAALMNKIFIVIPAFPIIVFLFYKRRFKMAGMALALPVALLAILVFVQNPQVRPKLWTPVGMATASGAPMVTERSNGDQIQVDVTASPAYQFVETIYLRTIVIPGQVVTAWFRHIPENLPYAKGCAYRWAAAILRCEFQFMPQKVHDIENPILVREGIKGTMTAANFMEDYANFGRAGLIGSGIVMGFLLALIGVIYGVRWRVAILLNLIPIAMLVELPLSTILLTGGWAFTTLLYALFKSRIDELEVQA